MPFTYPRQRRRDLPVGHDPATRVLPAANLPLMRGTGVPLKDGDRATADYTEARGLILPPPFQVEQQTYGGPNAMSWRARCDSRQSAASDCRAGGRLTIVDRSGALT